MFQQSAILVETSFLIQTKLIFSGNTYSSMNMAKDGLIGQSAYPGCASQALKVMSNHGICLASLDWVYNVLGLANHFQTHLSL